MSYNKEKNPTTHHKKKTRTDLSLWHSVKSNQTVPQKSQPKEHTSFSSSSEWKNGFNARESTAGSSCDASGRLASSTLSL